MLYRSPSGVFFVTTAEVKPPKKNPVGFVPPINPDKPSAKVKIGFHVS